MRVLIQNIALPQMQRKQKHVVSVGGWPIGHGQARFVAGYKTAKAEQQKSRSRSQPREPVEPGMAGGASHVANLLQRLPAETSSPPEMELPFVGAALSRNRVFLPT